MQSTKDQKEKGIHPKPQIVIKKIFNQPLHKVWDSISDKTALSKWLMKTNDFELTVNHEFLFTTEPRGNFDGKIKCKVISFKENEELYYSWKAAGMIEPTYVRWTIKEIGKNETSLQLEHFGFQGFKGWMTKHLLNAGWKKLLTKKLLNYLSI